LTWRAARVAEVREEATGIRSLVLLPTNGAGFEPFAPGAHVDLRLGPSLVRPYSLVNTVDWDGTYHVAVKLEPTSRGGSRRVHDATVGEEVEVGLPRNNFPLAPDGKNHLLLAGGIGVTPILGMARHLRAAGRDFAVRYFGRSAPEMAFVAELTGPDYDGRSALHAGLEPDAVRAVLQDEIARQPAGTDVYACGPAPFMALARELAGTRTDITLHLEYFSSDPAPLAAEAGAFRIVLGRSGRSFEVARDRTIVEVLAENGIAVPTSCEQGVCGTCQTAVLAGRPDHRDLFLSDEEHAVGNTMMLCVSRSLDPELVLDL
jgi:vanillate monooxygenase ferredoxin subunit